MQYIKLIVFMNFGAIAISLAVGMVLGHLLFKSLKKNHPTYFEAIGKPIIIAPVNFTEESYGQLLKSGVFAYSMVFRGLPKVFPKDEGLRRIALAIRISLTILFILVISLVVTGYLFYKSTNK